MTMIIFALANNKSYYNKFVLLLLSFICICLSKNKLNFSSWLVFYLFVKLKSKLGREIFFKSTDLQLESQLKLNEILKIKFFFVFVFYSFVIFHIIC